MSSAIFNIPLPPNDPIKSYAPGSKEKESLKARINELKNQIAINSNELEANIIYSISILISCLKRIGNIFLFKIINNLIYERHWLTCVT